MRKIAVVTGTRAEYGLLYWLLKGIETDSSLQLQLIVTGMHLSPEFGMTVTQIEADGFEIAKRIDILLAADTPTAVSKSLGLGVISFADVFQELNPDILLIVGDRFEILAAATAAMLARIPIAHCHGGESTEGAVDESIRHAITKMSHLHFASANVYRQRIIQMGEQPGVVFNVGALGIENTRRMELLDKAAFEASIDFSIGDRRVAMITFHPVTLENQTASTQFQNLLDALETQEDLLLIFTKPNADVGGKVVGTMIDIFVRNNSRRAVAFTSLGQLRYLSALKYVDLVIGNSSSGIIEMPSFGKPTINIGDRQHGRIQAGSVINCEPDTRQIVQAIEKALSPAFSEFCKSVVNPYDGGMSSGRILSVIKEVSLDNILKKRFYDYVQVDQQNTLGGA